jgi:hypothetical protein
MHIVVSLPISLCVCEGVSSRSHDAYSLYFFVSSSLSLCGCISNRAFVCIVYSYQCAHDNLLFLSRAGAHTQRLQVRHPVQGRVHSVVWASSDASIISPCSSFSRHRFQHRIDSFQSCIAYFIHLLSVDVQRLIIVQLCSLLCFSRARCRSLTDTREDTNQSVEDERGR